MEKWYTGAAPIGNFLRSTWNFFRRITRRKKTRQVIKKVARTTPETGLNYSEKFNSLIISVTWYRFETFHATLHRLLPTTNFVSYLMIAPSLFCQWTWVPFLLFIFPYLSFCSSLCFIVVNWKDIGVNASNTIICNCNFKRSVTLSIWFLILGITLLVLHLLVNVENLFKEETE